MRFEGELRYVCPHCGTERETVLRDWTAWGSSEVDFSIERGRIVALQDVDVRDAETVDEEDVFRCPGCREELTAEDIVEGFRVWLERVKEKNPELYTELIAELL